MPSALERGVVDGVLTANAGGGKVWKDLLKYCYEIGLNFFEANIAVNKEAFAKLPAELSRHPHQGGRRALAQDDADDGAEESEEKAKRKAEGMIQTTATPERIQARRRAHGELLGRMGQG